MKNMEAVVLTRCRRHNSMTITCSNHTIQSQPNLKYLVHQVNMKMKYTERAEPLAKKAAVASRQIARIMPNVKSPKQAARRLTLSVVTLKLLYAVPM